MFKRKTTALFLLLATMIFLVGISAVSATSDNDTVIQDNSYSEIDQSIAEDNSDKLNKKSENNNDNTLKANYNTKQSITTVTTEPTTTDRKIMITAEVKNTSGVRIKNSYFKLYYNNQLIKTISTGSGLTRYYYTVPGTAQKATIKAVYQGNSMYGSSSASYTNYVSKQSTKTTLKVEPASVYNQVKISAEVRDKNNNLVPNSQFKIYCDGKLIKSIGTRSGITRFDYTLPYTYGDVTIKSVYQGSTVYKTSSAQYAGNPRKQSTKTILKVEPTSVYNQVKITSVVRDDNYNLVPNSQFKVYCNDNLIKSIGTRSGITSFYYDLPYYNSAVIIKSEYQGSTLYKASSAQYAGNPRKQNTYTYLSLEPTSVYNQIKITAEVKDNNNNLVQNSQFKVYNNGNLIKSIGTKSGITKFYYTAPNTYVTIKAEYQGSTNYYSSYDVYNGYIPQKEQTYTYVTVSKTNSNKICIIAQVTDTNYNPVKNSKFNLYYDGKLITTIGTSSGTTKYYYTIPQQYNNYATISAKYLGNNLYKTSEDSEEIYVPDYIYYKTIELNTYNYYRYYDSNKKYADGDEFESWYQTVDGQWNKGVYIHTYPIDGTDMDSLPYNMLVDATFYFKNSAGNIILRQYDDGNGLWLSHNLISGYTPYKVVAKYRKMTQSEQNLWDSGYYWNPKTGEWRYYTY